MKLQQRIDLFERLGKYLQQNENEWQVLRQRAFEKNPWFTPQFIDLAAQNIVDHFLTAPKLSEWTRHYHLDDNINSKTIGIVMAGNIPLVGFHDMLSVFISGHKQLIKPSSKDDLLLKHVVEKLIEFDEEVSQYIAFSERLTGCDAYIATGSNNSSRYFEQYFGKYPSIIRRNKTSVAILSGRESTEDLEKLSDDIHMYFGLGCRNVTKILVPRNYDFVPLLGAFHNYRHFRDYQRYANNYDYQLSILLLNGKYYMTNGSTLLAENESAFSPISVLNYGYYENFAGINSLIGKEDEIQAVVGEGFLKFGTSQRPGLFDYADGVDTIQFLLSI